MTRTQRFGLLLFLVGIVAFWGDNQVYFRAICTLLELVGGLLFLGDK